MLNKKYIALFIILLSIANTYAQTNRSYPTNPDRKRGFNWLFGDSIWLDFKTNPPTQRNGSQLKALESAAAISDTAGKLLFYTDGITVWNANHKIIINGTGLNGDSSSSQGCLFIPQPNSDSIFYLFTTDWQGKSKGFCYNKIILKPNADSSIIIEKNIKLLPSVFESISATTHANGLWKWVVVRNSTGRGMYAFLITDKGINNCGVYSDVGHTVIPDIFACQSKSAFSNNSFIYANSYITEASIEFSYFYNHNGKFIENLNSNVIGYVYTPTGFAFSNDNKYCYVSERDYRIVKVNCSAWGEETIHNHNDTFSIIGIRMSPYNQIYCSIDDSLYIGKIYNPDKANTKFVEKGMPLNNKCTNELTNFDNSYNNTLGVNFTYTINCSTNTINILGADTFNATTYQYKLWNNTWQTIGNTPNLVYTLDSGNYQIKLIATKGSMKDSITRNISIGKPIAKHFLGRDTGYCKGSFPTLKLQLPSNLQCYKWNNDSTSSSITINKAGIYMATITTNSFCQLADTIRFYEDTTLQKPIIMRKGDSLISSIKATQYQWFFNGNMISNSREINIKQLGIYQLVVYGYGGCFSYSDTIHINQLKINNNIVSTIKIYPNPINNILAINGLNNSHSYNISISDITGKKLHQVNISNTTITILNLETLLANGIYFLDIIDNYNNKTIQQFIKQ